jgi:tRNA-specific 2-thiouridylase
MKVLVGLSGGVDSAVCALLLKRQGLDVSGAIMTIWNPKINPAHTGKSNACLGPEQDDIDSVSKIAKELGIDFRIIDCKDEYEKIVLQNFRAEYQNGRTPNPCIWCNSFVKFGVLPALAKKAGLEFSSFATGHYAKISYNKDKGIYELSRPRDKSKDQTYFLYRLTQKVLSEVLFPLGDLTKAEVRQIAKDAGLSIADKPDSQDFYSGDYNDILKFEPRPGDIVDLRGNVLGRHNGVWNYTIGKRRGLGIAYEHPLYVVDIDPVKNIVVVGKKDELYSSNLSIENICWTAGKPPDEKYVMAKIRQQHIPAQAEIISIDGDKLKLKFAEPQMAVTKGQSAVFYDGDIVLGGGFIC